jgi:hypothetical protein
MATEEVSDPQTPVTMTSYEPPQLIQEFHVIQAFQEPELSLYTSSFMYKDKGPDTEAIKDPLFPNWMHVPYTFPIKDHARNPGQEKPGPAVTFVEVPLQPFSPYSLPSGSDELQTP